MRSYIWYIDNDVFLMTRLFVNELIIDIIWINFFLLKHVGYFLFDKKLHSIQSTNITNQGTICYIESKCLNEY